MEKSPDISTNDADVADALNSLHISDVPLPLADTVKEPNPWQDQLGDSTYPIEPAVLPASDSSLPEGSMHAPSAEPESEFAWKLPAKDVLNEFDPLVNQEQQAAEEAWAHSESHSAPGRIPLPRPGEPMVSGSELPEPPPKDVPSILPVQTSDSQFPLPRASGSNFPSLAALARTFSIPSIPRSRPISVDATKAVPSPTTISSFGSQQEQLPHDPETSYAVSRSGSPGNDGTGSSRPGRDQDKEPPFDFQKFLDQMKLKAAEPVSKYLRSYVLILIY